MGNNEPKAASPGDTASGGPPIDWTAEWHRHRSWLQSVVVARVWESDAVEEVMQDIAVAAVSSRTPPRASEKLAPWLYKVAVRQSLLYRRRRGRQRKLIKGYCESQSDDAFHDADPLDWLLAAERQKQVRISLGRLHRRDREVLLLKYAQHWTYEQIAGHLGVSLSAVESRLHRARQRLRLELARNQVTRSSLA